MGVDPVFWREPLLFRLTQLGDGFKFKPCRTGRLIKSARRVGSVHAVGLDREKISDHALQNEAQALPHVIASQRFLHRIVVEIDGPRRMRGIGDGRRQREVDKVTREQTCQRRVLSQSIGCPCLVPVLVRLIGGKHIDKELDRLLDTRATMTCVASGLFRGARQYGRRARSLPVERGIGR